MATFIAGIFSGQAKERRCNLCGEVNPVTEFYKHKNHKNPIGECKACRIKKNKPYCRIFLVKNPEYNALMNKKHRERKTELQREYNKRLSNKLI